MKGLVADRRRQLTKGLILIPQRILTLGGQHLDPLCLMWIAEPFGYSVFDLHGSALDRRPAERSHTAPGCRRSVGCQTRPFDLRSLNRCRRHQRRGTECD